MTGITVTDRDVLGGRAVTGSRPDALIKVHRPAQRSAPELAVSTGTGIHIASARLTAVNNAQVNAYEGGSVR